MSAHDLLASCRLQGIELAAEGDRLRFRPQQAVSADLRRKLAANKAELLALLVQSAAISMDGAIHQELVATPNPTGNEASRSSRLHRAAIADAIKTKPEYGCWNCGCREFARDLADTDWVCTRCHPVEEYRAHLPRCTSLYPSRRGGT